MVSKASIKVSPSPNHSLQDLDKGFSSSWPQAKSLYPFQAWRKASITASWRSLMGTAKEEQHLCSGLLQGTDGTLLCTTLLHSTENKISSKLTNQCNGKITLTLFFSEQPFLCRITSQCFQSAIWPSGNRDSSLATELSLLQIKH